MLYKFKCLVPTISFGLIEDERFVKADSLEQAKKYLENQGMKNIELMQVIIYAEA